MPLPYLDRKARKARFACPHRRQAFPCPGPSSMQYLLCLRLRLKPNTANPATGTAREFLGEALQELAANHQPAPELPMSSIANGENHAGSINSQNSEPHGFGRGFLNKPSHGGQNAGHPVPRQDMQEHLAQRAPSANGAGAQRMTRSTARRIGVDSYDAGNTVGWRNS